MATEPTAERLARWNSMPLRRRRTAFKMLEAAWRAGSLTWRPLWIRGEIVAQADSGDEPSRGG